MKYTELKDKDLQELQKLLKEKKSLIFELKVKLKTMQLTKPSEISIVRKDIARISTAISSKFNVDLGQKNDKNNKDNINISTLSSDSYVSTNDSTAVSNAGTLDSVTSSNSSSISRNNVSGNENIQN